MVIDVEDCYRSTSSLRSSHTDDYHHFSSKEASDDRHSSVQEFRMQLLTWYVERHRKLPWRQDPIANVKDVSAGKPCPPHQDDSDDFGHSISYGVWVSEIMLQQTRVETVIEYWKKWMKTFPTIARLAAADIEDVNHVWSGLGYYSRARNLHKGAQYIMEHFDGRLPRTAEELKSVPGIGPYTAGAISSIAFQQCEPLVDGNVIRVVSRLRAIPLEMTGPAAKKLHWELAGQLVDPAYPGDFNQALMELGATVCTPQRPLCATCPVRHMCRAFQMESVAHATDATATLKGKRKVQRTAGPMDRFLKKPVKKEDVSDVDVDHSAARPAAEEAKPATSELPECSICQGADPDFVKAISDDVTRYPLKVKKTKVRKEALAVFVVVKGDEVLVQKRPENGLLAGLWEFPNAVADELDSSRCSTTGLTSQPKGVVDAWKASSGSRRKISATEDDAFAFLGTFSYQFSHISQQISVFRVDLEQLSANTVVASSASESSWVPLARVSESVPLSTQMKRVLEMCSTGVPSSKRKYGTGAPGALVKTRAKKGKISFPSKRTEGD